MVMWYANLDTNALYSRDRSESSAVFSKSSKRGGVRLKNHFQGIWTEEFFFVKFVLNPHKNDDNVRYQSKNNV